ncbi:hypothetical protein QTP70_003655 [Hemibagrus guttatus]|uniref:Myb/SANT-like DNA-binding domain-containing protein 1 n=1 Tax=Hemibagrus guttatus TaxID=175788 RepID=A0AAE0R6V4_9TELE|nr:hypothetical protein QTP70_003655 [Hemibagrus guttatus]
MKGLLYIWEEYVTELKKAKRNAKIYEMMAKRLYDLTGEHRHREEIKMKITNMTFQYRQVKLKHTTSSGGGTPDWPYYKSIERILSKIPEHTHMSPLDPQNTGASTSQPETSVPQAGTPVIGFLPEYTGSSEEREVKEEDDDEGTEVSVSAYEEAAIVAQYITAPQEAACDGSDAERTEEDEPCCGGHMPRGATCNAPAKLPASTKPAASGANDELAGEDDSIHNPPYKHAYLSVT